MSSFAADTPKGHPGRVGASGSNASGGSANGRSAYPFRADLDLAELDDRHRPGMAWSGRGIELSRSSVTFRSRRLCYEGRRLIAAVHLVDDRPVPLFGIVTKSEYDGEGLYRTTMSLHPMPDEEPVRNWIHAVAERLA